MLYNKVNDNKRWFQYLSKCFQDLDNNGEEYVGIYTCFASNGISNAQVEAILTVPGAPGPARKLCFLIPALMEYGTDT